jgi:DNA recombination protein RmuC
VIVDSKVSLTAYDRFCQIDGEKVKTEALADHLQSVRNHHNELCTKDYTQLLGNRTLDFVVMCIPLEPAYQTALLNDQNLLYDIASTRVVITGPTTLMITLKLIAQIWRRENENRNAETIAEKAGRIYEQVRLIVESMTEAKKKLNGVADSFDEALKRLQSGKGNLVGKIEDIRQLGAKVHKEIPAAIIEQAIGEEKEED